jgi:hypothetical protein
MTKHSQTPWEADYKNRPKGKPIAIIRRAPGSVAFSELAYVPHHGAYSEANAKFIVQAVNAHDALLAAVCGLLAAKDSVTMGQERELYAEWLPKARAAVALATEEVP